MYTQIFSSITAPRFRRWVSFVALTLPLGGCLGEGTGDIKPLGFLNAAPSQKSAGVAPLQKVSLYRGNVVVAAPKGYCVHPDSLRKQATGSFVLLASCESLSGKLGHKVDPALISVSVLPRRPAAEQPSAADLAASVAPAKVIKGFNGDGVALLHLASGGNRALPNGDPKYWRAGMVINGHVIGLAVYGSKGSAVSGNQGKQLIIALAESLRDNSPVRNYAPALNVDKPAKPAKPKGLTALFGGLFPNPS